MSGVQIPITNGFFLTGADFAVNPFDPLGIGGSATGTIGPPLGGRSAIGVRGTFAYTSKNPETWRAGGDVSLPWLSAFSPKVTGSVSIQPGRAMTFHADANVSLTAGSAPQETEFSSSMRSGSSRLCTSAA